MSNHILSVFVSIAPKSAPNLERYQEFPFYLKLLIYM